MRGTFADGEPQAGKLVRMDYKSGRYIGEIVEQGSPWTVVKVLAVLKHPDQGDLHHPFDPDVPMFHERKALSYTEKARASVRDLEPYAGIVPDYRESLAQSLETELAGLDRLKRWAERGIAQLEQLKRDY